MRPAAYIFEKTGIKVLYIEAAVTKEEDCKKVVLSTVEKYGRLDILVNNAGTSQAHPFEAVGTDLWQQDLDLKLFGAIHCSRYALPYMRQVGGGAIVNVTAGSGKTPVSRAAGMALTKAMFLPFFFDLFTSNQTNAHGVNTNIIWTKIFTIEHFREACALMTKLVALLR